MTTVPDILKDTNVLWEVVVSGAPETIRILTESYWVTQTNSSKTLHLMMYEDEARDVEKFHRLFAGSILTMKIIHYTPDGEVKNTTHVTALMGGEASPVTSSDGHTKIHLQLTVVSMQYVGRVK